MADEQVVQGGLVVGDFTQGGAEQVEPQATLDLDGFVVGGAGVKGGQGVDVPLVGGALGAEVLLYAGAVGRNAIQGEQGAVPEPFVQRQPSVGRFQGAAVGWGGVDRPGVGPAQQPVPAVGEDAGADAFAGRFGQLQVVVQLLNVGRVGVETAGGADAPLELNESIQSGEVNGAAGAVGRRVFLDDFVALRQPGQDEKIPHRRSNVGLHLKIIVPPQNRRRRFNIPPVANIQMRTHSPDCSTLFPSPIARGAGGEGRFPLNRQRTSLAAPRPPAPRTTP